MSPTSSSTSRTRTWRLRQGTFRHSNGNSTFSNTDKSSMRLKFWKMKPMLPRRISVKSASLALDTSVPPSRYCPLVGASNRATTFRRVDLPQPEGPMTATNSPSRTSREMASSAVVSPAPVRYTLRIFRSRKKGLSEDMSPAKCIIVVIHYQLKMVVCKTRLLYNTAHEKAAHARLGRGCSHLPPADGPAGAPHSRSDLSGGADAAVGVVVF